MFVYIYNSSSATASHFVSFRKWWFPSDDADDVTSTLWRPETHLLKAFTWNRIAIQFLEFFNYSRILLGSATARPFIRRSGLLKKEFSLKCPVLVSRWRRLYRSYYNQTFFFKYLRWQPFWNVLSDFVIR